MLHAANDPSVLDWVKSIGDLTGTVATLAAVLVALWVARRDGRHLRAEWSDREAGQARLITADIHDEDGRWWVRTTNHSAAPVFAVEVVEVRHESGTSAIEPADGFPAVLDILDAGQARDRRIVEGGDPSSGVAVLRYLDAAGLRWYREGARQPERELG